MAAKRGSSWEGTVNHKGQRYRRSFATEQQADAWVLESKAKLIRGEPVDMGENVQTKRKGTVPLPALRSPRRASGEPRQTS